MDGVNGASNGHAENGRFPAPLPLPRRPVRVAVVGLGYWGPNLVRNFHELPEAEVACVCDLRPEALAAIGRRYPSFHTTTHFEEVLEDPSIEAVAIATPVTTHYQLASAALAAGKHVFVEKPLAASSEQALELLELSRQHRLVLMPGHTFLYSPAVNKIRDLIAAGELGDIYFISASRVNLGPLRTDVSVLWDLGPHDFSILRYWLGESPTQASAIGRGWVMPGIPDVAFVDLEFPSGTIAHVELSWLAPSKLRRTTIVGSKKMIIYDDTSHAEPVRVFDSGVMLRQPADFGEYQLSYRTGEITSPRVEVGEPLLFQMRDFCDGVLGFKRPRDSAELGVEVVQIIETLDRSMARGGELVPIEYGPLAAVSTS